MNASLYSKYVEVMQHKDMLYLRSRSWKERVKNNPFLTVWLALKDRFWYSVIALTGNPILPMRTFWGEKIAMPFPNYRCVLHHGLIDSRELPVEDYIVKNVTDSDVFLDIGANVGFYALLAHALGSQTWAFEPTPSTFKILRENLKNTNAVSIQAALMDTQSEIDFLDKGVADGTNTAVLNGSAGNIKVRATTLDAICQQLSIRPTFLKMDVEGAELLTLKGGEQTLKKYHPTIVVETAQKEVVAYLQSLNYHAFNLTKDGVSPFEGEFISENLLFK